MADKESGCEVFGEGEGVILKRGMLYFTKRAKNGSIFERNQDII